MKTFEDIDIRQVRGHWECQVNGAFFCSGDTFEEIIEELVASNESKGVNDRITDIGDIH